LNVIKPEHTDIGDLYDLILPYAGISWQGKQVEVNPQIVMGSLWNVIHADNFVARLIEDENEIVAFAFGYFGNSWWTEPDCAVDFFYVSQNHTGKGYGRALVKSLIEGFKEKGCGWMYAGAESDISEKNGKIYQNLFKKFGFRDIGGGRMILNLRGI
jgi:GNAT superfamily N-acetyltransferase